MFDDEPCSRAYKLGVIVGALPELTLPEERLLSLRCLKRDVGLVGSDKLKGSDVLAWLWPEAMALAWLFLALALLFFKPEPRYMAWAWPWLGLAQAMAYVKNMTTCGEVNNNIKIT